MAAPDKASASISNKTEAGVPAAIRHLAREPLFRLLAINWLIGAFAALIVTVGLLALDTAGLRTLMAHTEHPVLPAVVLFCGLLITFCSAAMGAAIMAMPKGEDQDRGRGSRLPAVPQMLELQPALAPARARPRR
ncbi:hypothetical protein H2509_19855 [Stappia sp. F7233]|uniref:Uncharacterized protein n=1 Tax=Stappia albiluteola TaxID=2758565 RepID=A0A839AI36_9HYPH|nr:hypothetical protein [Stappia albiluteola]MBA5779391.1 hypothetical protein [Stappia albiluteola]